ncbi:MAG: glutamyl-tRNA reductase [Lachnospira eligens]
MGIQMQLGYVGINYKNTDLSVRDKITFTDSGIADFMQQAEEAGVKQCMCLSTCNRCEVFYLYEDETFVQVMSDLFNDYFGLTDTKLAGVKCGEEALVYLFCIAAGLESMVLGEDQILGQLKDAADLSRTLGHSGKELNYIVREAVSCAKRIKTEYKVSENQYLYAMSGSGVRQVCGISGKHALVIGSGKTAALAIRYLAEYGADVTVCSRTYQHAKDLLKEFPQIEVIAYDKKTEALKSSDIVVSATSSPHLVIRASELSEGKKMTLLDLAAPRDIEKSAGDICGVTLIDLDRIGGIVKSNQNERAHLLKESQCVIDEYIAETKKWLTSSRMDTTIQSLAKM